MKTILLPVDIFHETGWEKSLQHAVGMAKQHGSTLHVLAVIPDFGMSVVGSFFPEDYSRKALAETEAKLADFVSTQIPGDLKVLAHVKHGTTYKEILACADEVDADMIVMASHRPEMRDYLLGPNAARVVRHAHQSVCVIR